MFLKEKKINYGVVVLAVLLVLALGYILVDKYNQGQQEKLNAVYDQGVNAGMQRANQLIMNQIMADLNSVGATAITIPISENKSVRVPLIAQTTIIGQLNQEGKFSFQTVDQNNQTVTIDLILPQMCSQMQQQAAPQLPPAEEQ